MIYKKQQNRNLWSKKSNVDKNPYIYKYILYIYADIYIYTYIYLYKDNWITIANYEIFYYYYWWRKIFCFF